MFRVLSSDRLSVIPELRERKLRPFECLVVLFSLVSCQPLLGQNLIGRAILGEPYGVAMVEMPILNPVSGRDELPLSVRRVGEVAVGDPVLFPASQDLVVEVAPPSQRELPPAGGGRLLERVGELFRELSGDDSTRFQTVARRVFFLFRGSDPFKVEIWDEKRTYGELLIEPSKEPTMHRDLLLAWWDGYMWAVQNQIAKADYPTVVESYLLATLARQNQLPLPESFIERDDVEDNLVDALKLIGGAEEVGEAIFRLAAVGVPTDFSSSRKELPKPPTWTPVEVHDEIDDSNPIEPIASRVPPECFYIRYGSFENYLWFKDLSEANGGDISKLVTLRGVERNISGRVERQLAFRMTQLSRVLGGTLVQDQALIGRDLYLTDGAALGVLFQSANPAVLHASMSADRRKIAAEDDDLTIEEVAIAGRSVSFLSKPDGSVRSFLAMDGDYLLVSNSQHIIERFFELSETGSSLATTISFRKARGYMPLSRDDTVFAYFSPEFFQGLVSPAYMIELRRRLFAKADLIMVQLSRLLASDAVSPSVNASVSDVHPTDSTSVASIDYLIQHRFLPAQFGERVDGSGVFEVGEKMIDSLRGARGTFMPICDIDLIETTDEEAEWYQRIANAYSAQFSNFDPVMVGVQRRWVDRAAGKQQVSVHAEVAPWDPGKYGVYAQQLGPPTRTEMRFAPDDIVSVQGHVASEWLGPPTHLFAAIKDTIPPDPSRFAGVLKAYLSIKQIPGYLGAWPQPGALDRLPLGLGRGRPVGPGMTKLVGGLYRYNDGQFSVVSFHPDVLAGSLPHLAAMDSQESAQIRLKIGDLGGSQLRSWVNEQLYQRASESSSAGAAYLDLLAKSMPIQHEDAMRVAEEVLDGKIQCTLGGEYQLSSSDPAVWISSAWNGEEAPNDIPGQYQAPVLRWFHGVKAWLTQLNERLVVDFTLDLERS